MTSAVAVASFTSLSCAWSLLPCQSARSARGASNVKSYGSSDGNGSGGSVVLVGTAVAARSWCRWRHRRHSATRAAPLELASDFDAEDPELRVEAAHSVGAFSLTSTLWPPKKLLTNTAQLSPIKAETSVGRYTGSAPVFAEWPFYEIEIANVSSLEDSAEELQSYRIVNFEQGLLTRAFVLTSRWQKVNLGRSAGFQLLGMGLLSGFKSTNPILMRELQGLNILQGYLAEKSESESPPTSLQSEEEFDEFMKEMEASDFITEEFRAVAPVQRDVYVTGLVSSAGSSLSIWTWKPGDDYIEVHFCLGTLVLCEMIWLYIEYLIYMRRRICCMSQWHRQHIQWSVLKRTLTFPFWPTQHHNFSPIALTGHDCLAEAHAADLTLNQYEFPTTDRMWEEDHSMTKHVNWILQLHPGSFW